jgi:hypothetical protein
MDSEAARIAEHKKRVRARLEEEYWNASGATNYNYFRDYDPSIGRYVEGDPIGVGGHVAEALIRTKANAMLQALGIGIPEDAPPIELNLYGYASADPLRWIDPDALSSLSFDRGAGQLCAIDKNGNVVFCCPAANNTTKSSNGPWANGTYRYSHYNRHSSSGPNGPYGSHGIFVFDVPGRTGIGVHSGRSGPSSATEGCIRTTDNCMKQLTTLHASDPLTSITVK